jgi:hypothetical protein
MMNQKERDQFAKIPAKYRHMVDEVEYDPGNDMGRWWVYLVDGWVCYDSAAPHTIHEDSWKACMDCLRNSVPEHRPTKIVCAWCGKVLNEGIPPVSHGMCEDCYEEQIDELEHAEGMEIERRIDEAIEKGS